MNKPLLSMVSCVILTICTLSEVYASKIQTQFHNNQKLIGNFLHINNLNNTLAITNSSQENVITLAGRTTRSLRLRYRRR